MSGTSLEKFFGALTLRVRKWLRRAANPKYSMPKAIPFFVRRTGTLARLLRSERTQTALPIVRRTGTLARLLRSEGTRGWRHAQDGQECPSYRRKAFAAGSGVLLLLIAGSLFGTVRADEDQGSKDVEAAVALLDLIIDVDPDAARKCMSVITGKVQNKELAEGQVRVASASLEKTVRNVLREGDAHPLYADSAILAATLGLAGGQAAVRDLCGRAALAPEARLRAFAALIFLGDDQLFVPAAGILRDATPTSRDLRAGLLAALGKSDSAQVADLVLSVYDRLDPELRPKAVELLTQRSTWSKSLLQAIGARQIPASALNANQVAKMVATRDEELGKLVAEKWGSVRTERNPQRELVINDVRKILQTKQGDPSQGQQVFQRVCGQCHKIYGQGQEVGPDITANGRASFEQLLSNVLDPSLTIGASYQARTIVTVDGRVLNGLLVEDNDQRVILKMQGGKSETIPREDIEELKVSQLSLMPEGLETQLKTEELVDLFAYLTLDKPPTDPESRYLPGTPRP